MDGLGSSTPWSAFVTKRPRKRETHDRRRVLNLLESDYSKVIPKMMTLTAVLCTWRSKISKQDSWAASPSVRWLHTFSMDAQPHWRRPFFWCSPGPGRTPGMKKQPLAHPPRNQAVSLQVCLILNQVEISRLQYSISLCHYRTSAGCENLRAQDLGKQRKVSS